MAETNKIDNKISQELINKYLPETNQIDDKLSQTLIDEYLAETNKIQIDNKLPQELINNKSYPVLVNKNIQKIINLQKQINKNVQKNNK